VFYQRHFCKAGLFERRLENDGTTNSGSTLARPEAERKQGNRAGEDGYASQLRGRYPTSPEYQEFLKGNFEW
jgi:Tfp pilus assembly protein PilF